jgi:enamine deaminase RidA (YjgF/YER057c/UK114 family)
VVKTTVFLKDMGKFAEMTAFTAEYFPSDPPPLGNSGRQIPKNVDIDIEAIAFLG